MSAKELQTFARIGRADFKPIRNQTSDEFVLENVCGVSCASKTVLAANPANGTIAFAASSILVTLDPTRSEQDFLGNPSGRNIKAVAFSDDGKFVAFGEIGYNPNVFIYTANEHRLFSQFRVMDMCSVKAIEFHPKSIYVAVLCASSFSISIFDLRGKRIATATFVVEPLGLTLPKVGSYLVVCGHRKLSLFSLMDVDSNVFNTNIVFDRRSVLLGHQSDYTFVDVVSGTGPHMRKVYTVTSCGYLCDIKVGDILIDRAAKIDDCCLCVKYCLGCIFVGCAKNTVKICSPLNLTTMSTISDRDAFTTCQVQPSIWKFQADVIALAVNGTTRTVTVVYSDHRRHSWRISLAKDSIECEAIIPVDADGKEVSWQPTSYEIQSQVAGVLNQTPNEKAKSVAKDGGDKSDDAKAANHNSREHLRPSITPCYVNATRFTPDGKYVICGNAEGEIKIFDAVTGRLNRVVEAHNSAVTHIELLYDDDFQLVASGGRDRVIFILDAKKDHSLVQVLCDHSSAIVSISMAHHSGALTLVSSAADGVILIRRAIKGKQFRFMIVGELSEFGGKPRIYAYGNDYIITGGDNGQINLFQTDPYISTRPTKIIKSTTTKGKRHMKAVAIDPSGSYLVANSAIGTLLFNVQTGKHVTTLTKMLGLSLITFTNDCKYLVSESNDGCRFIWRLPQRMTEVMTAKMGEVQGAQNQIPYEKILSCMNLTQEGAGSQAMAQNRTTGDGQDCNAVPTSKIYLQGNVKMRSAVQESPSECESYSSCSTCSRSYTDVTDYNTRNISSLPLSGSEMRVRGLSEEAKRLLCDNSAQSATPTYTTEATTTSGPIAKDSCNKDKLPSLSMPSSVEQGRGSTRQETDTSASTPKTTGLWRRSNDKNRFKGSSPGTKRKSFSFRNVSSTQKRKVNVPKGSPDLPPSAATAPTQNSTASPLNMTSPTSEYLSADSHDSISRFDCSNGRELPAMSTDSKTMQPSEFVSEMHDCIAPNTQAPSIMESLTGVFGHDKNDGVERKGSIVDLGTSNEKSDPFQRMGNNGLRQTVEGETPPLVHADESDASSPPSHSVSTPRPDDVKNKTEIPDIETNGSLEIQEHAGDDPASNYEDPSHCGEDVMHELHPPEIGRAQDTNQNTDVSVEHDCELLANDLSSTGNRSDWNFVENSWNMSCAVCLDYVQNRKLEEIPDLGNEVSPSASLSFAPRHTQLSNTQETFFHFLSGLQDFDVIHDLSRISIAEHPDQGHILYFVQGSPRSNMAKKDVNGGGSVYEQEGPMFNGNMKERSGESVVTSAKLNSADLETGNTDLGEVIDDNTQSYSTHSKSSVESVANEENKVSITEDEEETACFCPRQRHEIEDENVISESKETSRSPRTSQDTTVPVMKHFLSESKYSDLPLQSCWARSQSTNILFPARERPSTLNPRKFDTTNIRKAGNAFLLVDNSTHLSEQPVDRRTGFASTNSNTETGGYNKPEKTPGDNGQPISDGTFSGVPGVQKEKASVERGKLPPREYSGRPCSSQPQSSCPANSVVIDGLGGVGDLFRNQDDYLRRLKEVRRNFEMSIQALRDDRRKQLLSAHSESKGKGKTNSSDALTAETKKQKK